MAICQQCFCNHALCGLSVCQIEKCRGEEFTTIEDKAISNGYNYNSKFLSSTCDNDYDWCHGRIWIGVESPRSYILNECYITGYDGLFGIMVKCEYTECKNILKSIVKVQRIIRIRQYRKMIFIKFLDSNAKKLNDDVLNYIVYSFL